MCVGALVRHWGCIRQHMGSDMVAFTNEDVF